MEEKNRMGTILRADNLSFRWNNGRTVFENISFDLNAGEVFCILGPNGTGKSTLLRCIINLLDTRSGKVYLDNTDIRSMERKELARRIAYVPQGYEVAFPFTILEYVLMGRAPYIPSYGHPSEKDVQIAVDAIREVGIFHLMDKPVNETSGGEHQLALIARALAQEPDILLLDEPTSHLDFGNQMQILNLTEDLADKGITIIMTSHFPDHAYMISHQVAILRDSAFMVIGPAEDVITSEALRLTYGIDVRIEYSYYAGRKVCIPVRNRPGCHCPIPDYQVPVPKIAVHA